MEEPVGNRYVLPNVPDRKLVHVWVNGKPANFRLGEDFVTLMEPLDLEPVRGTKAAIWRWLGAVLGSRDIYARGCESLIVVLYTIDGAPKIVAYHEGAHPPRARIDEDESEEYDERYD